jgi:hypothetical protein
LEIRNFIRGSKFVAGQFPLSSRLGKTSVNKPKSGVHGCVSWLGRTPTSRPIPHQIASFRDFETNEGLAAELEGRERAVQGQGGEDWRKKQAKLRQNTFIFSSFWMIEGSGVNRNKEWFLNPPWTCNAGSAHQALRRRRNKAKAPKLPRRAAMLGSGTAMRAMSLPPVKVFPVESAV